MGDIWNPAWTKQQGERCPKCTKMTVSEHQVIAEPSLRDVLKGGGKFMLKAENIRTQNNMKVPEAFGAALITYLAQVGTMHVLARLTHVKKCSNCPYIKILG